MDKLRDLFLDDDHFATFFDYLDRLLSKCQNDKEYQSLLYLLSSNNEIVNHINDIYDFDEQIIFPYKFATYSWQTGGSIRTTALAYNLYNGNKVNGLPEDHPNHNEDGYSVSDLFDYGNVSLFLNAIAIRYGEFPINYVNEDHLKIID